MSLIGCHTLTGNGTNYPKEKVTWRYIKGNEKDFENAPDWATLRTRAGVGDFFAESHRVGARVHDVYRNEVFTISEHGLNDESRIIVIAQRERITSVNDDRLARDMGVNTLIAERGSRYGKFADGAEIMRDLKHVMHKVDGWNNLTASQKEALDMIQHKIGRILNGDPTYDDSWKDIAGYATLIVEELNGVKK